MSSNTNPEPSIAKENEIDYTKYIPLITGGLIILGVSRLLAYYDFFGVNILSFLEFGEIITSFLDILLTLTAAICGAFVVFVFTPSKQMTIVTESEKPVQALNKWSKIGVFAFLLICFLYFVYIVGQMILFIKQSFFILKASIAVGLFLYLFNRIYKNHPQKPIRQASVLLLIFIISETLVFASSFGEYRRVKYQFKYIQTKITFDNETLTKDSSHVFISDSTNFYIGKTNNYIFIHHRKEGTTSVYPMASVKRIDIKRTIQKNWYDEIP